MQHLDHHRPAQANAADSEVERDDANAGESSTDDELRHFSNLHWHVVRSFYC